MADVKETSFVNKSKNIVSQQIIYEEVLVDSWLLPSCPGTVFGLVLSYLVFVLFVGPRIMANRKPFNLRPVIMVYNVAQVIYNGYLVTLMFTTDNALPYLVKHYCHPMDYRINPLRLEMCSVMWHYTVLKLLDLLDTVFFVLRKKKDQLTFLHVYHHTVMALGTFMTLKYIRGEQAVFLGFMNVVVHVVMYSYYFLSAFGERMRRFLWWKKYLTAMQIMQFVIGAAYLSPLVLMSCELPTLFTYFMNSQIFVFLVLFIIFYKKTYLRHAVAMETKIKTH